MNHQKIGSLIAGLRKEQNMTQRQLAEQLGVTDKAVSKWECGLGCADVSLLPALAELLGVSVEVLLMGHAEKEEIKGDTMKNTGFFVCSQCGNIITAGGTPDIVCCGRKLERLTAQDADDMHLLHTQKVEDEIFITARHPMEKEHSIAFVAMVTGDKLQLFRQYPQWEMQLRLKRQGSGKLYFYCTKHGLYQQSI